MGGSQIRVRDAIEGIADLHHRLRHTITERRHWEGPLRRNTLALAIPGSNEAIRTWRWILTV